MYGHEGIRGAAYATIEDAGLEALNSSVGGKVDNVQELLKQTMAKLGGEQ
jgi:hypothetical protein